MHVIHTQNELVETLKKLNNIAFVPTMGNLHDGHLKLIEEALKKTNLVVVSIFINPLQFNSKDDFKNYPRTLDEDLLMLEKLDVPFVFVPPKENIIDSLQTIEIHLSDIANDLCGRFRPGHFNGVATIICKLFNLIQPELAFFGRKDFQQLFLIKELVKQLNYPIHIIAIDTVRDKNGLAMSSRNILLSEEDRKRAPQLFELLNVMKDKVMQKKLSFKEIEEDADRLLNASGWIVDYLTIRSAESLKTPVHDEKQLVILGAATLGSVRLIDNIEFCIQD
ncbi:pantoate--beta-alanine ligase [Candidatus Methylopumilus rimovensis]|uniref:Pantothenate synthetase n=1 Tax=Candidatus Methylopumilus rimovensis TaxID=2588535 RepID=A0AAE6FSJ7_9PROT|nr:pantoate--beta-alanine ligase [Candidatus Methylopumilus rimovensis]QDD13192.1 pantoate--beta-alanine ligase [Candidatus Methylopumilus rimovensis]